MRTHSEREQLKEGALACQREAMRWYSFKSISKRLPIIRARWSCELVNLSHFEFLCIEELLARKATGTW
ncbi:MAG: hypothetical protein U0905_18730 [Pirellulales bacterium]